MIKMLLVAGADIDVANADGMTALATAQMQYDTLLNPFTDETLPLRQHVRVVQCASVCCSVSP